MENQSKSKVGKIVIGVMVVLLVAASAVIVKLYNKEKVTKAQLTNEKNIVLSDLKEMVANYDLVIEDKNLKETALNEARLKIGELIKEIEGKEATIVALGQYRKEVLRLRSERDFLFAQNDSLRSSNVRLVMKADSAAYEMERERYRGDSLYVENALLARDVALGKRLLVTDLSANGVVERSSGKLINTKRARRTDKIRVCFTIPENRLSDKGDKKMYVQVVGPNGTILGAQQKIQINNEDVSYSQETNFYFDGQELDICENISGLNSKFYKGRYTVLIYDISTLISKANFVLK